MVRALIFVLIFQFSSVVFAQFIDSSPTGKENFLPVEGGSIEMKIDTLTPLPKLIKRLKSDWEFNDTGKGYWIGYTNDMFSIANHDSSAIPKLLKFFKKTKSKKGKLGAIYTLHLIGIQRKIVGRWKEEFRNEDARKALLSLLEDKTYAHEVASLLLRDSWKSDIPIMMDIIQNSNDIEVLYPVINTIINHQIEKLPINNKIPDDILSLRIIKPHPSLSIHQKILFFVESYNKKFPSRITFEKQFFEQKFPPYSYIMSLDAAYDLESFFSRLFVPKFNNTNYYNLGCNIQYYFDGEVLHIISTNTAKKKLINWWKSLPEFERQEYLDFKKE